MSSSHLGDEWRPISRFSALVSSTLTDVLTQKPLIQRISLTSCSNASTLLSFDVRLQELQETFSRNQFVRPASKTILDICSGPINTTFPLSSGGSSTLPVCQTKNIQSYRLDFSSRARYWAKSRLPADDLICTNARWLVVGRISSMSIVFCVFP